MQLLKRSYCSSLLINWCFWMIGEISLCTIPILKQSASVSGTLIHLRCLSQVSLSPVLLKCTLSLIGILWQNHGLSRWLRGEKSACQRRSCGRCRFDPQVRKIPWRRKWQPTPVFLPGWSHRQRSLVGYSPWGHKESDTTEHTHTEREVKQHLQMYYRGGMHTYSNGLWKLGGQ